MKKWISSHRVVAFFLITFGITWPLLFITLYAFPESMVLQGTLGSLATFGPVLSAMTVASLTSEKTGSIHRTGKWLSFLLTWMIAGAVMLLFATEVRNTAFEWPFIPFFGLIALLPAWVISSGFSRREGVRNLLITLIRPKGCWIWYVVALLTFPTIQLAGYGLSRLFGGDATELITYGGNGSLPLVIGLTFLMGFLFSGGINEESGWRGFAIPLLQKRYSPLIASLIVWVFWALWHLPYDLQSGDPASSILINRLGFNLLWSVLFVWLFNRSRGSLLAPALIHPSMNTSSAFLPHGDLTGILFVLLTLLAMISDKMWLKRPTY